MSGEQTPERRTAGTYDGPVEASELPDPRRGDPTLRDGAHGVLEALDARGHASFSTVFSHALRGEPCHVVGVGDEPQPLPMGEWTREADLDDLALVAQCVGPTVDIGCGPGRLASALAEAGHVVLGIDVVHEAVGQTRRRGVAALRRDVFDELPGEGRWRSALLADGNVGIGGDPVALLARVKELLGPEGRIVVEVAPPGVTTTTHWAALECAGTRSRPFRWSVVGLDDIAAFAGEAGLVLTGTHRHGARWSVVLEEPR